MKKTMSILLALLLCLNLMVTAWAADASFVGFDGGRSTVSLASASFQAEEATYYVAGVTELCGTYWEANTPANKMTKNSDGIYTKTFTQVPQGTYQLKVTDGTWTNSWGGNGPEGNYEFTTTAAGDVIVKFDPYTKQISVILPGGDSPDLVETYYVAGCEELCGTYWEANTPVNKMTKNSDGIYTKTFTQVPQGTYQLKVTDGTWNNSWGGNGPEGNYEFTTTAAGDVTVKFDPSTKQISVDLPGGDPTDPPTTEPSEPTEETYYVAGCEELCGAYWEANTPANKMTRNSDGVYTKTFTQVPKGTYQLKVTDGTWNNSWGGNGPDGNYEFTTTAAGDVTVKFDPSAKQISVDLPGGGSPEPAPTEPVGPKYYVSGNCAALGDWNAASPQCLMDNKGGGVYQITYQKLPAGDYEFKITDGTWTNSWGDNGGNCKFKLDTAQNVTIIFKINNEQYDIQIQTKAPDTADFGLFPMAAAVLCAAMATCILLIHRKKLI